MGNKDLSNAMYMDVGDATMNTSTRTDSNSPITPPSLFGTDRKSVAMENRKTQNSKISMAQDQRSWSKYKETGIPDRPNRERKQEQDSSKEHRVYEERNQGRQIIKVTTIAETLIRQMIMLGSGSLLAEEKGTP